MQHFRMPPNSHLIIVLPFRINEVAPCKQVQRVREIDAILKPGLELEVCMQSQDYGAAARVGP